MAVPTPFPFPCRRVVVLSAGDQSVAAVSEFGDLYTWGDNTYGQLGHGNATSTPTPTAVTMMAGRPALKTLSVSMGDSHMLVVTDPGSVVYACGKNEFGQLGLGLPTVRRYASSSPSRRSRA